MAASLPNFAEKYELVFEIGFLKNKKRFLKTGVPFLVESTTMEKAMEEIEEYSVDLSLRAQSCH